MDSKNILRHEHALGTIYVRYQVHVLRESPIRTLSDWHTALVEQAQYFSESNNIPLTVCGT